MRPHPKWPSILKTIGWTTAPPLSIPGSRLLSFLKSSFYYFLGVPLSPCFCLFLCLWGGLSLCASVWTYFWFISGFDRSLFKSLFGISVLMCNSLLGGSLCKSPLNVLCSWEILSTWECSRLDPSKIYPNVCTRFYPDCTILLSMRLIFLKLRSFDILGHSGIHRYFWKAADIEGHHHSAARSRLHFILVDAGLTQQEVLCDWWPHLPVPGYLLWSLLLGRPWNLIFPIQCDHRKWPLHPLLCSGMLLELWSPAPSDWHLYIELKSGYTIQWTKLKTQKLYS